jgi:hypothetical protein
MPWRWIISITLAIVISPFLLGAIAFVYLKLHHKGPGVGPDDFIDLNKEEATPRSGSL